MTTEARTALDYAGTNAPRPSGFFTPLRVALVCGLLPALFGTVMIAAWLATRAHYLEALGLANIVLGLIGTVCGCIALSTHFMRGPTVRTRPVRTWLLPGVVAGTILLGNFPLCGFYLWVHGLYTVRVVNATGTQVSSFIVSDPTGHAWELGPIPPGRTTTRMMNLRGEGAVHFTATVGGTATGGEVEGYITGGMDNGTRSVTLNADGSHTVR